jgi:hypothetical protein
MRQAARADDHDPQILLITLDGAADRTAELEATRQRWQRMLHGVDRHRHDLYRLPLFAGPHQRHGNGHGMIDQHLLTHGDVELVGDERVDQVPGQRRIAGDRPRHRNAPAFILVAIFVGCADRESRQLVEKEVETVVVIEHHGDVGLLARQPVMDVIEALEERLPIRIVLFLVRYRLADRGHVCGSDATDDSGHGHLPAAASFALNSSTVVLVCWAPMSCTLRPKIPASFAR